MSDADPTREGPDPRPDDRSRPTSQRQMSEAQLVAAGIAPGLLRVSVRDDAGTAVRATVGA